MNDDILFPHQRLDVYVACKELAVMVRAVGIRDANLRDQAVRAADSVFLQLSEGLPSYRPKMRLVFFERARDSLFELVAALHLACEIGAIEASAWSEMQSRASHAHRTQRQSFVSTE